MSPESSADASGIARRDFKSVRRGYDTKAVRAYLDEVAVLVAGLQAQLVEAQARAAAAEARAAEPEELDQGRLVELVGEETAKVLDSARAAASDIRTKAQEAAARLVSEGQDQAKAIAAAAEVEGEARKDELVAETAALHELAEGELGRRRAEAEALAAEIIGAAEAERKEIEAFRERAREQADELRAEARVQAEAEVDGIRSAAAHDGEQIVAKARREAQHLVAEALGVREKLLGDLARRRRVAREQVERLNAARERLLAAYAVVQRTADEATAELKVALPAARVAADQAARRVLEEPEPSPEDVEAEMSTARMAGLVDADTGAGIEVDVAALAEQLDVNAADHLHLPDAVSWVTDADAPASPDDAVEAGAEDVADSDAGSDSDAGPEVEDVAEPPAAEPLVLRLVPDLAVAPGPAEVAGEVDEPPIVSDEDPSDPDPPATDEEPSAPAPAEETLAAGFRAGEGAAGPAPEAYDADPASPATDDAPPPWTDVAAADPSPPDAAADAADAAAEDAGADPVVRAPADLEPAQAPPVEAESADAGPGEVEAADAAADTVPVDAELQAVATAVEAGDAAEAGTDADAEPVDAAAEPVDAGPEPGEVEAGDDLSSEPVGAEGAGDGPAPEPASSEAPTPEPVGAEAAATNGHEPPAPARRSLDELFARVRGEQPEPEPVPPPERVPVAAAPGPPAEAAAREDRPTSWPTDVERAAARVSAARGPDATDDEGDSALLQRRDTALGGIEALLSRRLKRVLADEENDVLDLLRRSLPASVDEVLPEQDEHIAAYAQAAVPQLAAAAAEGAALVGGPGAGAARAGDPPHLRPVTGADTLATELGAALVEPLRARVLRTIEDGNDVDDVTRRLRSLYREWKGQRVGAAARHYAAAAYARGALDEAAGSEVRWLVDRTGEPCPDADDNALAGAVRAGDPFPTGDRCPPAHPGCRCLVVPAGGVVAPPEA